MLNLRSHIESSWNKVFKDIEWISLESFLFALFTGVTFSFLIISWDAGFILKLIMYVVFPVGILATAADIREAERKRNYARRGMMAMLLAVLICEGGLYHYSSFEEKFDITVITKEVNETENSGGCGKKQQNELTGSVTQYVVIELYDVKNNEKLARHKILKSDQELVDFYKDITGVRIYIDYKPFIKFKEKFEYVRKLKI